MRALELLPLITALTLLAPASAAALDPAKAGEIAGEIEERQAAILEEYGGRSTKEMSPDERREFNDRTRAARLETLEKHGTNEREFTTGTMRLGREGSKQMTSAKEAYQAARSADAKKKSSEGGGEIKVQRGFDEANPVVTEEMGGVQVQRGAGDDGIDIPVPPSADE